MAKLRILVAEDEVLAAMAIEEELLAAGFEVELAPDGEAALEACLLYTSPSPRDRG